MSEAPLFQRTTDTVHGMFTPLLFHLVMMGLALVGSGEVPRVCGPSKPTNPESVTLCQYGSTVASPSHPASLHPAPYTLHPAPYTLHPIPYTLHPTPSTLHLTPYTLYPAHDT